MKFLFALVIGLFLCGCCCEKYDLMDGKNAIKCPDFELIGGDFYCEFDKVVQKKDDFSIIRTPQNKIKVFAFPLKTVELDPRGIYELNLRFVGKERIFFNILGAEFANGKIRWTRPLARSMSFLNVNGAVNYSKEFAVSPGTEKLQPVFQLQSSANSSLNGYIMLVENLSITRKGDMKCASDELKKINFASDYDFSKYPLGDFKKMRKGNGPNAKKWSNVKADIVEDNGEKVLRIIRKPENYIYPFITLAPFKVDPRYYFVRVTFKAKGKGAFKSGLWWQRSSLYFDYENTPECKLTDKWQTFTMLRPCMTPDVQKAALSFTSAGDGEFYIKDIEVRFE